LHLSFDSYHGIKLSFSTWHDYLWQQYDETSYLIHTRHDTEQSDRYVFAYGQINGKAYEKDVWYYSSMLAVFLSISVSIVLNLT